MKNTLSIFYFFSLYKILVFDKEKGIIKRINTIKLLSLPSKINPNPDLPAAFIPFFRRIFFMAYAMKIHLKKNAAANGLELKERLQGLTATDVTHGRHGR